ncbi:TPA: hypothetical protein ACPY3P_002341 [Proteus mirabilis]
MDDLIKKILSKETLLLALLTGSSYFFAYLFEFGYSQYFNYPHEFISINIPNMDNIKSFNQTFLFGLCANGKVIADKYSGAVDVSFIVE